MTFRTDPDYEDEDTRESAAAPVNWVAAAAVSVLVIATVTLTIVAGGRALPFG